MMVLYRIQLLRKMILVVSLISIEKNSQRWKTINQRSDDCKHRFL